MKLRMLGVAAGLAMLPALGAAQTPPNPAPVTPPTNDSTVKDTASVPTTLKTETTPLDSSRANPVNPTPVTTPTITPNPTINLTPPTTTTTTDTSAKLNPPTTTTTVEPATPTTSATGINMGSAATSNAAVAGMLSSSGAAPATGSAFAMGTHSAARDSLVGPRPEPPGDGTTCPWGCPTSKGVAGLSGPQFLALQQELRDRKCGNVHVTGRLDAATRMAIRNCAKKMGVANTAAAVLVGFDVGFSASDVGISSSGEVKQED